MIGMLNVIIELQAKMTDKIIEIHRTSQRSGAVSRRIRPTSPEPASLGRRRGVPCTDLTGAGYLQRPLLVGGRLREQVSSQRQSARARLR
ncbi:MAG: hypothetical protein U1E17_12750 [Geminicoccaceae bacterium]